jgi:hypothetical protein
LSGFPSFYKWDKRLSNIKAGDTIKLKILRGVPSPAVKEDVEPKQNDALVMREAEPGIEWTFDCVLTEKPLDILRSEDDFKYEQVPGNNPIASCATTLASVDLSAIEDGERAMLGLDATLKGRWAVKELDMPEGMGVEFSMPLSSYLKLAGVQTIPSQTNRRKRQPEHATASRRAHCHRSEP